MGRARPMPTSRAAACHAAPRGFRPIGMSSIAYSRTGTGAPLVLLAPLGLTRTVWDPVLPELTRHFDVIAVDLPGFGQSPPMPDGIEPSPEALAGALAQFLDELGVATPHVAGNSLGGWVALELAALRPVASVTLLSPAGLWAERAPSYSIASLRLARFLAQRAGGLLSWLVRFRLGRLLVLQQTHGRPMRLPADRARLVVRELGRSPGFDATLAATRNRRYRAGSPLAAPVTIAFGSRDLVLLGRRSRRLNELPPDTRVRSLPGCGHVPSYDDPEAVAALIVAGASSGRVSRPALRPAGHGPGACPRA
jgi:pimeloyl-ACP methyl ester carboxylesterase